MAKFIDISVFGDKQLQRDLNSIGLKAGKKIIRKVLRDEAKIVMGIAKANSPVATGALRGSIKVRASTNLRKGQFGIEVAPGTRTELGIDDKDEYYYPAAIEFGRNIGKSKRAVAIRNSRKRRIQRAGGKTTTKQVPAKPFLRPAFDGRKDAAMKNIMNAISEGVKKIWKR